MSSHQIVAKTWKLRGVGCQWSVRLGIHKNVEHVLTTLRPARACLSDFISFSMEDADMSKTNSEGERSVLAGRGERTRYKIITLDNKKANAKGKDGITI